MWCVCWTQFLACCHVCSEFPGWWLLLLASVRISFGGHSNVGREVVRRQWRWWSCSAEKMSPLFELQQLDLSPPPLPPPPHLCRCTFWTATASPPPPPCWCTVWAVQFTAAACTCTIRTCSRKTSSFSMLFHYIEIQMKLNSVCSLFRPLHCRLSLNGWTI